MIRGAKELRARRSSQEWAWLVWDVMIVILVSINLALILFDSLFVIGPLNDGLRSVLPSVHGAYEEHIHANFHQLDLYFVAIFIVDVILGWTHAIVQRRYQRWWFYPFAHWYDVLGCIPLSGFRMLRVLRVIAILLRLQRLGLIEMRDWLVVRVAARYYDIALEEISDRVIEKILTGLQREVRGGASEVPGKIIKQLLMPRRERLSRDLARHFSQTTDNVYQKNREELRGYIHSMVKDTIQRNGMGRQLERIPGFGDALVEGLTRSFAGASFEVVEELVQSLGSDEFERILSDTLASLFDDILNSQKTSDREVEYVMVEILELLKAQVRKKRWLEDFA